MKSTGNKLLNILLLVIVALIIYLSLVFMNHEKEAESLIDNRFLYEWDSEADPFFPMMNQYVNDRISFRYDMLRNQMIIKDRLFFEPSMMRGKDGLIFPTLSVETVDHDLLDRFGQYLSEVKNVCKERSIPFLFVLNPTKTSIYPDKLPDGYVYHRLHPQAIEAMLELYDIPYVSTYHNLKALADNSIPIYNVEYDQNHWNDLGMFYGVNVILEALQDLSVKVSTNNLADFSYSTEMKYEPTTHPFPINDEVPVYTSSEMQDYEFVKDEYKFLDEYMNDKCLGVYSRSIPDDEVTQRLLIYQGSYMNRKVDFVVPRFAETMIVHSYHVIQFLRTTWTSFSLMCLYSSKQIMRSQELTMSLN